MSEMDYSHLHEAVELGDIPAIRRVLGTGVHVDDPNPETWETALIIATLNGNKDVVFELLNRGANPNIGNAADKTPVHYAAEKGLIEILELYIGWARASPNGKCSTGETPLHLAIRSGHVDAVRILLEAGADANESTADEYMGPEAEYDYPLHIACRKGRVDIAKALLEHDADVNVQDWYGATPLYRAVRSGNEELVQLLLTAGADKEISTHDGTTPLEFAHERRDNGIISLLTA